MLLLILLPSLPGRGRHGHGFDVIGGDGRIRRGVPSDVFEVRRQLRGPRVCEDTREVVETHVDHEEDRSALVRVHLPLRPLLSDDEFGDQQVEVDERAPKHDAHGRAKHDRTEGPAEHEEHIVHQPLYPDGNRLLYRLLYHPGIERKALVVLSLSLSSWRLCLREVVINYPERGIN